MAAYDPKRPRPRADGEEPAPVEALLDPDPAEPVAGAEPAHADAVAEPAEIHYVVELEDTDPAPADEASADEAPADERELAQAALAAVATLFDERGLGEACPPLYARVDIARDADDRAVLLEMELFEPSYFLDLVPGAEELFVDGVMARLTHECAT